MTINSEMLAAVLFLFFGFVTVILGWSYGVGDISQPGAGAVPVLAGLALCGLGVVQFLNAVRAMQGGEILPRAFSRSEIRPLVLILGAVFAFAFLVTPLGLVPALAALSLIAWFAQKGGRRWEIAGAMLTSIVFMIAIFKYGLGIPLRLFAAGF